MTNLIIVVSQKWMGFGGECSAKDNTMIKKNVFMKVISICQGNHSEGEGLSLPLLWELRQDGRSSEESGMM